MSLVEAFTDVKGRQGRKDQGLNGTGEQAQKHHGQGHDQRNQVDQHAHSQFVGSVRCV